jgi:hypothetical protein
VTPRACAGLALALLALVACNKPKATSPEFEQASRKHSQLYAEKFDEAYLDPRMGQVEALLQRVPPESADAQGAQELLARITAGRERAQTERAEREKARAAASAPVADPFGKRTEVEQAPPPPEEKPDAGSPVPVPGMPMREFSDRFTGCFRQDQRIHIQELNDQERDTWVLKDIANCRDRFPGFDKLLLIEHDNTIWRFAQKSAVQTVVVDAGTPAGGPPRDEARDAGTP